MTKEEFRRLAQSGLLFLDGATGSNLQKQGMPVGVCPELWITEHEEIMSGLQKAYLEAGTNILYAPTFTANRIKLKEFDLEDRIEELNHKLVEISKRAADGKALVAGDLTMTGQQLKPMGPLDFEELIDVYKEQIRSITEAGADLLVVETMMSLQESRAALIAAKETCPDIPVMVTMTFESDGRSLFGTDAATAAIVLSSLGADAVGANCSTGPDQMAEVICRMAKVTDIPIIAKPNAGLPSLDEKGQTVYDMGPEEFGADMELLLDAGAQILGGCCGTTPEHIRKMTHRLAGRPVPVHGNPTRRALTSERASLTFDLDGPFLIVGERINPTGKKKLQQELREGSFELVTQFAQEQEERGASILDVNMGMSGIDEKAMMLQALEEVAGVTKLPLSIDSSHVDIIEAALRIYPGRALVNSISLEKEKIEYLLPIAKKYGAMFILLPLSDEGLPKDSAEKHGIIREILRRAEAIGMGKEDIVVDGLVATIGANPKAALECFETFSFCKNEMELPTVCGLSNISFGLPERSYVNTAFLTMAIGNGLTMAIANPSQELLMNAAFASDMLLNKEESGIRYIGRMNYLSEKHEGMEHVWVPVGTAKGAAVKGTAAGQAGNAGGAKDSGNANEARSAVFTAVLKGNKNHILDEVKHALDAGETPDDIINGHLIPAINEVGELFDKQKYFLPQLISSANTMKVAIEYLEPMLARSDKEPKATLVVATVEGDIHDIGKNLVVLMLKNYGYHVIDLGKDVPADLIVDTAMKENARVIGLSALMTTTMMRMKDVVELVKERGCTAKVVIGGAAITESFAEEIGADGYSKDAAECVKLVDRLLEEE